ncbi:hypothetical protein FHS43_005859 [Streptosporangium becharense]|uniref:Uncharacterized protein n=1 Tax=Streptosporangium becharense TaxID=1816182 RepID=A0A7W9MJM3_9ACTN|nr:hypothetical protein [Streptosporangium becharense]MBB2914547.1 hypothetical protein [Streptosporangium becharense]MBB5823392.1 hypothetical protein [Streptosporangium becharense]
MLLPLLAACLLVNRSGWRPLIAAVVAATVPLGGYALWHGSWHGSPALNGGSGVWLWARTMPFADCAKIGPPADEAVLCPSQPAGLRPGSPHFIWSDWSPLRKVPGHPVVTRADLFQPGIDELAGRFARRAILGQPLDYFRLVARDLQRTLNWRRGPRPDSVPILYNRYAFPNTTGPLPDGVRIPGGSIQRDLRAYQRGPAATRFTEPAAELMRLYQTYVFLPGPLFGVLTVGTLLGYGVCCAVRPLRRTAGVAFLPLAAGAALTVGPVVVTSYDSRYWLPAVPLFCLSLAIIANGRSARPGPAGAGDEPEGSPIAGGPEGIPAEPQESPPGEPETSAPHPPGAGEPAGRPE